MMVEALQVEVSLPEAHEGRRGTTLKTTLSIGSLSAAVVGALAASLKPFNGGCCVHLGVFPPSAQAVLCILRHAAHSAGLSGSASGKAFLARCCFEL